MSLLYTMTEITQLLSSAGVLLAVIILVTLFWDNLVCGVLRVVREFFPQTSWLVKSGLFGVKTRCSPLLIRDTIKLYLGRMRVSIPLAITNPIVHAVIRSSRLNITSTPRVRIILWFANRGVYGVGEYIFDLETGNDIRPHDLVTCYDSLGYSKWRVTPAQIYIKPYKGMLKKFHTSPQAQLDSFPFRGCFLMSDVHSEWNRVCQFYDGKKWL